MSAISHGMDVAGVGQLATLLSDSSGDIGQIQSRLSGLVNEVQWKGSDRESFLADWNGQYVQQLTTIARALSEHADTARQEIAGQEDASAT